MQNLDKITDKIMAEAQHRADGILAEANAAAERITGEADERALTVLAGAKNRAEREALAAAQRAYSSADMKGREIMLATKVGLINKVFREARRQLLELEDGDYCVFVAHLLADAAAERIETVERLRAEYGDEENDCLDFEVLFAEGDRETRAPLIIKTAKAFLRKKSAALGKTPFKISEESADIDGGVILRYGDIETNCSVDTVIAAAREKLEGRVAEILFSDDGDSTNDENNENEE